MRLLHLVTHPIQYFAPLYRELATRPELELTVCFLSRKGVRTFYDPGFGQLLTWDIPLLDGYHYRFLEGEGRSARETSIQLRTNLEVVRSALRDPYDVLWVHGYGYRAAWLAILAARLRGRPVLLREEATLLDRRPLHRRVLKEIPLRWLSHQVSGLYIGLNNYRYSRRYGIPEERLFSVPYAVDNHFFAERAERLLPQKQQLRVEFGLPADLPVLLFCGKLIPKKDPLTLLSAFQLVRRQNPVSLLFAGDGVLRREIEGRVTREELEHVRVTGFLNQSEIARAYAAADVVVLPSVYKETWGLVVNEAMNFSLPIVVSDRVGCAADLVKSGVNGFVVPPGDSSALATALRTILEDSGTRQRFGEASLRIIQNYSIERAADGVVAASLRAARDQASPVTS